MSAGAQLAFSVDDLSLAPSYVPVVLSEEAQAKEIITTLANLQLQAHKLNLLRVMNNHGPSDQLSDSNLTYAEREAQLDRAQHLIYIAYQPLIDRVSLT